MPKIIPIRELKNTAKLSGFVREADGPVFVTKNGYDDMVIMSTEVYDRRMFLLDVYEKLDEAESALARGGSEDMASVTAKLREKYAV